MRCAMHDVPLYAAAREAAKRQSRRFDNGLIIVANCLTLQLIWTFQAVGQLHWSTKRGGKQCAYGRYVTSGLRD